jgi:hypothetical protein
VLFFPRKLTELRPKGARTLIVTARAIYKGGRLIFYNSEETPEDGAEVVVIFERRQKTPAFSLRGSWAKYFPKDFDLDEELKQIRKEWEEEMEEMSG